MKVKAHTEVDDPKLEGAAAGPLGRRLSLDAHTRWLDNELADGQAKASDKHVAIKFIHARLVRNPKDRERLESAFRSAKGVKHDGIIRYGEFSDMVMADVN